MLKEYEMGPFQVGSSSGSSNDKKTADSRMKAGVYFKTVCECFSGQLGTQLSSRQVTCLYTYCSSSRLLQD